MALPQIGIIDTYNVDTSPVTVFGVERGYRSDGQTFLTSGGHMGGPVPFDDGVTLWEWTGTGALLVADTASTFPQGPGNVQSDRCGNNRSEFIQSIFRTGVLSARKVDVVAGALNLGTVVNVTLPVTGHATAGLHGALALMFTSSTTSPFLRIVRVNPSTATHIDTTGVDLTPYAAGTPKSVSIRGACRVSETRALLFCTVVNTLNAFYHWALLFDPDTLAVVASLELPKSTVSIQQMFPVSNMAGTHAEGVAAAGSSIHFLEGGLAEFEYIWADGDTLTLDRSTQEQYVFGFDFDMLANDGVTWSYIRPENEFPAPGPGPHRILELPVLDGSTVVWEAQIPDAFWEAFEAVLLSEVLQIHDHLWVAPLWDAADPSDTIMSTFGPLGGNWYVGRRQVSW